MSVVYVATIDHGCEGHTPPFMVFPDKPSAMIAKSLAEVAGTGCWAIYEVPMWPAPAIGQYWDMKPVTEKEAA